MKFIVFGSEGIGGNGIIGELKYNYPDADIIRIDKRLHNDYDGDIETDDFIERQIYEFDYPGQDVAFNLTKSERVIPIPLNTQKLKYFRNGSCEYDCLIGNGEKAQLFNEFEIYEKFKDTQFSKHIPKFYSLESHRIDEDVKNLVTEKENRFCLKKIGGNGGRGFYIFTTDVNSFGKDIGTTKSGQERWYYKYFPFHGLKLNDWIFQQYCNGWLTSVDVLYSWDSNISSILMRKRLHEVGGITTECKREHYPDIFEFVEAIGLEFRLSGIHGFQFKQAQSIDNQNKLIDWNPRLQSGIAFGRILGMNILKDAVDAIIEKVSWSTISESMARHLYYGWQKETRAKVYGERSFNVIEGRI